MVSKRTSYKSLVNPRISFNIHMSHFNMDETYRLYNYALSFIGVHIFSHGKWDSNIFFLHQFLNAINSVLLAIFTTGFIVLSTADAVLWIEGVCIWITGVIAYITVGVALVFRRKFRKFLEEMVFRDALLDMPLVEHVMKISYEEGKLKELKELVENTQKSLIKYTRLLLKSYSISVFITAILYICDAVYRMTVANDKSLRIVAFLMWVPWSMNDYTIYIATFIYNAYAALFVGMAYSSLQSMLILLMGQTVRQLHIMTFILLHLDQLMLELVHQRDERWQNLCTSVLSQCVKHYVMTKSFSNRLNVICRPFYLALIMASILLVCVCSVEVAISETMSYVLLKYIMHAFVFVMMVLLFCTMGQQVQNECDNLERAVTEKWNIYNQTHKKNVLIFLMALSQNMPIYIFGTIPLSLPTFTWFIKTGMSFFTLAMSVLEG